MDGSKKMGPLMKHDQIPSLTGLRFVAAMLVVISHSTILMLKYNDPPTFVNVLRQFAFEGMSLFFVLSGFVIYLNYSRSISSRADLRNFFVARFARLYPLYFICVCFDLLIKFSYNQFPTDRMSALPYYVTMTHSWFYKVIVDHSLIYQFGLLPQVSWSISTEFFFYLAFPFVCIAISKFKSVRSILIGTTILCGGAIAASVFVNLHKGGIDRMGMSWLGPVAVDDQDSLFRWAVYFSPYMRIFEFVLGCLCAALYMMLEAWPPSEREQQTGMWVTIGALVCLPIWHWLTMFGTEPSRWRSAFDALHWNFGYAPFLAIMIFSCARYRTFLTGAMSGKWIVLAGEASYSIYLLHFLIIGAFRYEAATITSWNVALGTFLQLIVVFAAIIGLSLVSWTFIEIPCRRWIRNLLSVDTDRVTQPSVATIDVHG